MARKKDLCRKSNGLFMRSLGWKRTESGYAQHKFYLGRDEHKARVASLRLEQLWDQVCRRWERDHGWRVSGGTGKTLVRPLDLGKIRQTDGTPKFDLSLSDEAPTEVPPKGVASLSFGSVTGARQSASGSGRPGMR